MDASGAGHGSQPQPDTREAPTDHISPLPDDLLLQLLPHLGDTRTAARTTILSRRWLGLFSRLPGVDVTLCDVPLGSLEDALRRAARPELRLIDIAVPVQEPLPAATVSAVLREAARLSPAQVRFALPPKLKLSHAGPSVAVDLPGFGRATSIDLRAGPDIPLTHARASTGFPLLESLSLSGWRIDLAALIPRCPRLRVLTVTVAAPARAPGGATNFSVQSLSLQGLVVDRGSMTTCRIIVQAPVLKRLAMSFKASRKKLSVSIVAPVVENVSWRCSYGSAVHRLGLWHLLEVSLETADGHRRWTGSSNAGDTAGEDACSPLPRVNVLSLRMCCAKGSFGFQDGETEFVAEISKHMVTDFSRLELHLTSTGHGFGSFVWRLLGTHHIRNATRSLRIVLLRSSEVKVACQPNCPCDGPWNWRNQPVCSPNLEKLEIEGFEGEDHEFDFLKLVFRHAWKLRRVTVRLPDQVTPNGDWCTKLHNIFMAYPSVEANVDLIPGN